MTSTSQNAFDHDLLNHQSNARFRLLLATNQQLAELVGEFILRGINTKPAILAKFMELGGKRAQERVRFILDRHAQDGSGTRRWIRDAKDTYTLVEASNG